jgi:hypothetical protein
LNELRKEVERLKAFRDEITDAVKKSKSKG